MDESIQRFRCGFISLILRLSKLSLGATAWRNMWNLWTQRELVPEKWTWIYVKSKVVNFALSSLPLLIGFKARSCPIFQKDRNQQFIFNWNQNWKITLLVTILFKWFKVHSHLDLLRYFDWECECDYFLLSGFELQSQWQHESIPVGFVPTAVVPPSV